eukprot:scaffold256471_cov16-Tisochrysis_lutea.AAC.1
MTMFTALPWAGHCSNTCKIAVKERHRVGKRLRLPSLAACIKEGSPERQGPTTQTKRIPRFKAPSIPSTMSRKKRERSMGIKKVNCSTSCLIMVMRVGRSLTTIDFSDYLGGEDAQYLSPRHPLVLSCGEHFHCCRAFFPFFGRSLEPHLVVTRLKSMKDRMSTKERK